MSFGDDTLDPKTMDADALVRAARERLNVAGPTFLGFLSRAGVDIKSPRTIAAVTTFASACMSAVIDEARQQGLLS